MKKIIVRLKDGTIYSVTREYLWLNVDELNDTRKRFIQLITDIEDLYVSKEEIKSIESYDINSEIEADEKEK